MLISTFKHEFKSRGGVLLNSSVILFRKPLELWNMETGETIAEFKGNDVEVVLDYELDGKKIRDIISGWSRMPVIALHKRGGDSGMSYTHKGIPWGGGGGSGFESRDLNARFNASFGKDTSFDKTLEAFRNAHASADKEHGITVDVHGFVTSYIHGTRNEVMISGGNGEFVFHNHPKDGWPTFSGGDLINTAMEPSSGIVASSSKQGRTAETAQYAGDYIFTKTPHFKASSFVKAVKTANLKGKDYNDAVNKWLTANQKKYGYVYVYRPEQ